MEEAEKHVMDVLAENSGQLEEVLLGTLASMRTSRSLPLEKLKKASSREGTTAIRELLEKGVLLKKENVGVPTEILFI
ncbi:MAG: hypothetical protein ABIA78_00075 [archaeon]